MEHDPTRDTPAGPLAGLRVLDLSNSPAGAQASQTLADFGAEVVQVEPPGGGVLRDLPSYPLICRGKKSMVLDLRAAGDAALARDMALGEWAGEPALASATSTEAGPGHLTLRLLSRLWRRPTTGVPAPIVVSAPA